jgi:hypothetical protein
LGLDTYDFDARMYDPVLGRTFQLDPHLENYLDWSPYSWTGDNPIIMIDPTGMDWFYNDQTGETFYHSSLQKGAEEEMIEGWQWMGANNMFKGEDDKQLSGEDVVDANIDLVTYGEETENADGETSTMAFFAGENGKKFMDKMGYKFLPTQITEVTTRNLMRGGNGVSWNGDVVNNIVEKSGYFRTENLTDNGFEKLTNTLSETVTVAGLPAAHTTVVRKRLKYTNSAWKSAITRLYKIFGSDGKEVKVGGSLNSKWSDHNKSTGVIRKFKDRYGTN